MILQDIEVIYGKYCIAQIIETISLFFPENC